MDMILEVDLQSTQQGLTLVSIPWGLGVRIGLFTPISSHPIVTNIQERSLPVLAALSWKDILTQPKLAT